VFGVNRGPNVRYPLQTNARSRAPDFAQRSGLVGRGRQSRSVGSLWSPRTAGIDSRGPLAAEPSTRPSPARTPEPGGRYVRESIQ
jgi:hypothetical protein